MKLVQITDTHLSPSKRHFNANWQPLADWVAAEAPDLVVHTGDLSVDGADSDADLAFAIECLAGLGYPVLCLPGNHDIGHLPGTAQPVDAARLGRWRRIVGPDRWIEDRGRWRLIGIDSLICGADSDDEAEQFAWLAAALATRGERSVAIFAHKPLFVDDPHEGDSGYWGLRPKPRRALADLLVRHDVALFASGHLHVGWQGRLGGTSLLWAPSSSFMVGPMERDLPGTRMLGAAVHVFGAEVHSAIVAVPGLTPFWLDDVAHEVYPPARAAAATVP